MAVDKALISGSMTMLLLRLLAEKDMYGYEMIDTLRKKSCNVFELKAGTLYPLLHGLEGKGLLKVYEQEYVGKTRKYYTITKEGRALLETKKAEWSEYQSAVANVLAMGGVNMEKYLEKLLLQIRCKKARPYIAEEIRGHIESQIEDNIADGMSYEEAEKNAVADMGDPVTVGISLDKIHKPQIAWKLLVIVGILSLLGILLQQSIFYQSGYSNLEPFMQEMYQLETESFVYSVFIGFVLMCGIYFIDYTVIAKYSKIIGLFIITMGILLLAGFFGGDINGVRYSIGFGMFRISATSLMMFYVPIYGAILYKYRDGGFSALLKSIVCLIIPVFITFRMPNLIVAIIMMISMLIQLTVAILKGWFKIYGKKDNC